jgi:hypothetical protein
VFVSHPSRRSEDAAPQDDGDEVEMQGRWL